MKVISLSVIALLFGSLLSATHHFTKERIDANRQAFELRQMQEVIGSQELTIEAAAAGYDLLKDGQRFGSLNIVTTTQGYNGTIRFWLATTLEGEVLGVRIIEHKETPGLGDKLELSISDWVLDFEGTSLEDRHWDVKKYNGDFDQFSGATITPRAVVLAVAKALEEQP